MFLWLTENLATIIISAVLIVIVTAIVVNIIRNKRKGNSSCGCGCGDCPMSSSCHRENNEDK